MRRYNMMLAALTLPLAAVAYSCESEDDKLSPAKTSNPAAYISNPEKLAMLHNVYDLNGDGSVYEIDYTADYKLDEVLDAGITSTTPLFQYIGSLLYDNLPSQSQKASFGAGCSAFAAPDTTTRDFLMGRNYDFRHSTKDSTSYVDIAAFVVRTAPEGGKKSISLVDGLNLGYGKGFYNDGATDLSLMMGLPYAALDGINEDGFAIGILALRENQTNQQTGKKRISSTVAIRMLLDRASTVKEAVKMLEGYDMDMRGQGSSNYHFFMADATGDYAIVEYTYAPKDTIPTVMEVFSGNDTLRCVTNFYVSPTMVGTRDGWGSDHGKDRYFNMRDALLDNGYALTEKQAWSLLRTVSQEPTQEITSPRPSGLRCTTSPRNPCASHSSGTGQSSSTSRLNRILAMHSHLSETVRAAILTGSLLFALSSCTKDNPVETGVQEPLTLEALSTEELFYTFTYSQTIENEITHVALSKPDKLKGTAVVDILVKMRPLHGFDSEVNEATDYYLVTSTISVQSEDMYKGNFTKKHGGVKARICGYYLKGLKSDICLTDTTGKEAGYLVQVPTPETLIGQKTYTTGWGLSIGGAVTAGTLPGITSKLGVTVSSKSSFEISDCDIVSRHKGSNVGYDYILNNLPTYNSKLKINPPPPSATSTVTFTSQWIWAVPTDDRDDTTYYILKAKLSDLTYGASYFYSSKADYHDLTYKLPDAAYSNDITPPNRWPTGTVVLTNTELDSYVSEIKFKSDRYNYSDGSSNYSCGKSFSVNLPAGKYSLSCTIKGAKGQSAAYNYESKVCVTAGDKVSLVSGKGFVKND